MTTQKDRLAKLIKYRDFAVQDYQDAKRLLALAEAQYQKAELRLFNANYDIEEFKRECFTSPKLDTLPIDSRIRKLLKARDISTIYELRFALRNDSYIPGIGDLNKDRLKAILSEYERQKAKAEKGQSQ